MSLFARIAVFASHPSHRIVMDIEKKVMLFQISINTFAENRVSKFCGVCKRGTDSCDIELVCEFVGDGLWW